MEANCRTRCKRIKRRYGLTNDDVAKNTKLSESNVGSQVARDDIGGNELGRFPPWLKLAVVLDEHKVNYQSSI